MKRLVIGVLIMVALMITVWLLFQNQKSGTIRGEYSDFAVADTASIDRILMKDQNGNAIDLRREEGFWMVNGEHVARQDAINILLTTIKKVSLRAPVNQPAIETTLKLIIADHTFIEIYAGGDEPIKAYYVGGPTQDHTGTNMLMKNSTRPFITHIEGHHGFLTTRYFTNELEWRSRQILGYSPGQIRTIHLSYNEDPARSFMIDANDQGGFDVMVGPEALAVEQYDTTLLLGYLSNFKNVHYESYEETKDSAFIDSVKTSAPFFTLEVVTTTGANRMIHGYRKPLKDGYDHEDNAIQYDLDRLYIWVDSNELYVAQYAIFDKLIRGGYFLKSS